MRTFLFSSSTACSSASTSSAGTALGHTASGTQLERGRRTARRPHFDHERDVLLRWNGLDQEERQLGVDRLELDGVHLIVDHRRQRGNRFRVSGLAQQAHGADADFRDRGCEGS